MPALLRSDFPPWTFGGFFSCKTTLYDSCPCQTRKASSAQKQRRAGREKALQARFWRGTDNFQLSALPLTHFSVASLPVLVAVEGRSPLY